MCSDDTEWIKQYPNFMLTYRWRRRGRKLAFSWPISSIFTIIHVELWMPDYHTDSNSYILLIYVKNIWDESARSRCYHPWSIFCYNHELFYLVCVDEIRPLSYCLLDDSIPLQGQYIPMCNALNLNYDVLDKRNHKGLTVDNYKRFFNKNVTIASEERGTNDILSLLDS